MSGLSLSRNAHRHNFDPDAFVRSTDTLYIASSADYQQETAPLFVALLHAIYQAEVRFNRRFDFHKTDRPPVFVALDEARHIAPTPYLMQYLNEGLGQGWQTLVFLQNFSQAVAAWGEEGRAIISASAVKVAFGGMADEAAINAFSALCGDYDRVIRTESTSHSFGASSGESGGHSWGPNGSSSNRAWNRGQSQQWSRSTSTTTRKERRVSPADVATIPPGRALVVNLFPQRQQKSQHPHYDYIDVIGTWHETWQKARLDRLTIPTYPPAEDISRTTRPLGPPVSAFGEQFRRAQQEPDNRRGWREDPDRDYTMERAALEWRPSSPLEPWEPPTEPPPGAWD